MQKRRPILVHLILTSFSISILNGEPRNVLAAESATISTPESVLNEKRTATELPTKRKLPTAQTVKVQPQETDAQIRNRLSRIAASQEVFKKLKVSVTEGIVTLQGEVEEETYAKSFSALSEKVSGVIGVVDQLKITNVKKTGLRQAQSEVHNLTQRFFKFIPYLASSILILTLTLVLGFGVYRLWLFLLLKKMARKPVIARNLAKLFAVPIYILGFYLVLQVGGLGGLAATLVGGTGMLGIILGLASKNIIENILSGFMLTLRNPFQIGDQVIIGTESGVVHGINSRCTMLLNHDGIFTQIPNSTVLTAVIKNLSAHALNRVSFTLQIDKTKELAGFEHTFQRAVQMNSKTIAEKPLAQAVLTEISGDKAIMQCSFWVDNQQESSSRVKSNVMQSVLFILAECSVEKIPDDQERNERMTQLESCKVSLDTALLKHSGESEKKILTAQTDHVRDPEGQGKFLHP